MRKLIAEVPHTVMFLEYILQRMVSSMSFWQAVLCSATLCIIKQTGERNLPLFLANGLQLSVSASAGLA